MAKKALAYFISFYFLLGSIVLPLGDFSLIKDLPQMYHAYEKLATPDDRSITDFIGDYLLGGKDIFGHNKNDIPETGKSAVQFQHAAGFCSIVSIHSQTITVIISDAVANHPDVSIPVNTSEFHNELFRPPLNTLS
ncbi:MAG: hypothetical protein JST50_10760 [Bacteroidetes bacterium]|jgi:hypothetical protein|nr:hypothetical protein [Bacteroidota bacterium]